MYIDQLKKRIKAKESSMRYSRKVQAAELTPGPAAGHHNEAGISAEQAWDSFMHYVNKMDVPDLVQLCQDYCKKHNIPRESTRAFYAKLSSLSTALQKTLVGKVGDDDAKNQDRAQDNPSGDKT